MSRITALWDRLFPKWELVEEGKVMTEIARDSWTRLEIGRKSVICDIYRRRKRDKTFEFKIIKRF